MGILIGVLIAIAAAGLTYLSYKVTVNFLKKYRKRKNSQIVIAKLQDILRNMPNKEKMSFEDLESFNDETIIAEYDEEEDEIVQAHFVGSEGIEENVENALDQNGGMIVIED